MSTYIMDSRDGSDAMRIVSLSKGVRRPKQSASLGKEATKRLKWFDWHKRNGENVSRTCRHFDISRSTFYRWKGRYDPWRLETLEGRSTRPVSNQKGMLLKGCESQRFTQMRMLPAPSPRSPFVCCRRRSGVEMWEGPLGCSYGWCRV